MSNFDDFDFSHRMFNFNMNNPSVICTNSKGEPVVAYDGTHEGRHYAHIRTLYKNGKNEWCPGKAGITFPREEMNSILERLIERFAAEDTTEQRQRNTADAYAHKPVASSIASRTAQASNKAFDKAMSGLKTSVKSTPKSAASSQHVEVRRSTDNWRSRSKRRDYR
jgi:hypothetical protein